MAIGKTPHICEPYYELETEVKFFTCDGCKLDGFGERYICSACDNQVHKVCRFPKPTITHEFFERATFNFTESLVIRIGDKNPETFRKRCAACDKEMSGFGYFCGARDVSFHPPCVKLDKKIIVQSTIFDLKTTPVSCLDGCLWCAVHDNGSNITRGWSYVSSCKSYQFHVSCLVEALHETKMKNGSCSGLDKIESVPLMSKNINHGQPSVPMVKMVDMSSFKISEEYVTDGSGGSEGIDLGRFFEQGTEGIRAMIRETSGRFVGELKQFERVKLFLGILFQEMKERGTLAFKKAYKVAKEYGIDIVMSTFKEIVRAIKAGLKKIAYKVIRPTLAAIKN